MAIFHLKHSYLNWRAIPWRKWLRSFDFFSKNLGFLFIPLDLRFFYSRIWEFSFLHVLLELWFSWFFSILGFCLNSFEYLKCMTKQSIFLFVLSFFSFLFLFIFYNSSTSTNQRKPWKVPLTWCATSNAGAYDNENHIERVQFWCKVIHVALIKERVMA